MNTVGIDGCPLGWLAIDFEKSEKPYWVVRDENELKNTFDQYDRIFIDIPVGIPEESYTRECDEQLRKELGSDYQSSVFNPPVRPALYAPTYAEACIQSYSVTDKKVSLQAWNISDKIKQVDQLIQQNATFTEKVYESHPELLFRILNGWESVQQSKQTRKGMKHRLNLLKSVREDSESIYRELKENFRRKEVGEDDIVDAMVLAHFAHQSEQNEICQLPENPSADSKGITMAIHYVAVS
jgi:predicted RNase H-like nuclease